MKTPNIIAFMCFNLMFILGCSVNTSIDSVNRAKLKRVVSILGSCDKKIKTIEMDCIYIYAKENDVPLDSLILDAYGRKIILNTKHCPALKNNSPYSVGKNGLDECGRGDDVVIKN